MPTVQSRFSPQLHERFIAECEKRGTTPSKLIRLAVEALMDKPNTPTEEKPA